MIELMPYTEATWKQFLKDGFNSTYFKEIMDFLVSEKRANHLIYPPESEIYAAFEKTPFHKLKVVILGQDPYHGPGQAHGLSFSVPKGIPIPPSLRNIFKELSSDLGISSPTSGNLEAWATQGVLLLNATLTVRANEAGSHQNQGWEKFTDALIKKLSKNKSNLVFMLWGKYAQAKETLIDQHKHIILKAAHPSPFAAHRGFFGCKHFSLANEYLRKKGIPEIDWKL
ncbi:MAG: uracil-DNA glycosylase [Bacteroidetes bacterium]|nr:MAG: uracil-DNA glycosylase [Bacteroidota bacterium]